jgi:RimJ/RimL family protein N-acetyltransferase
MASQTQGRIHARVFRENIASIKTLEKLGFRFAGLSWRSLQGQPLDVAMLDYELYSTTAPSFGQPGLSIAPRIKATDHPKPTGEFGNRSSE